MKSGGSRKNKRSNFKVEHLKEGETLEQGLNPLTGNIEWGLTSQLGLFMGWFGHLKPSEKRIDELRRLSWENNMATWITYE